MFFDQKVNGKCIIVSAPSGAGKTTIVKALLSELSSLSFSISACSRLPRGKEIDGIDYYFIGVEHFKEMISAKEFVEWEEVYKDNFYGTLKHEVQRIWNENKIVVFDVDVVGALSLKNIFTNSALSLFIMPPNLAVLEERLQNRKTETEEDIKIRIAKAKWELEQAIYFDKIIINDELQTSIHLAKTVVENFIKT